MNAAQLMRNEIYTIYDTILTVQSTTYIYTMDCPYNIQHVNKCMHIRPSTRTYIYMYMLGEAAGHERLPIVAVISTHSSREYPVN